MAHQDLPWRPEPIKYGDIFDVSGELASKPIAPQDAVTMQSAENHVLGMTQKGGPAALMQSAAYVNEALGVVGHEDFTDIVRDQGVTIVESNVSGGRIIREAIAGQVVGTYPQPGGQGDVKALDPNSEREPITIGMALEAAALSVGDKPINKFDAAAIEAAELRATGEGRTVPGGVAEEAHYAAIRNAQIAKDKDKITLRNVLSDATVKLVHDKAVTKEDAEAVIAAEIMNDPDVTTHAGGVASTMAIASRLNQGI